MPRLRKSRSARARYPIWSVSPGKHSKMASLAIAELAHSGSEVDIGAERSLKPALMRRPIQAHPSMR